MEKSYKRFEHSSSVGRELVRSDMKPDRSMTDFYCRICDAHMYSEETWEAHVTGKRHLKNVTKPVGEMPSKMRALKISKRARLMDVIKDIEEPVVGLDFMTELERADRCLKPSYTCHLCQANLTWSVVIDHILDTKHRIAYIKAVDREAYDQIVSLQLSKDNFDRLIEDQAAVYEHERGKGTMEVKIEKPKMTLPPPRQQKLDFGPAFSRLGKITPRVSPERHSRSRSRCRSQSSSPEYYSRATKQRYVSSQRHSRNYSPESSRSESSRTSTSHAAASSRGLPDPDHLTMTEKTNLLRNLKLARLVTLRKLSRMKAELNPRLRDIFDE